MLKPSQGSWLSGVCWDVDGYWEIISATSLRHYSDILSYSIFFTQYEVILVVSYSVFNVAIQLLVAFGRL